MRWWGLQLVLATVLLVPVATFSVAGIGPPLLTMLVVGWLAVAYRVHSGTVATIPRAAIALGVLGLGFIASTAAAQAPLSAVNITLTIVLGVGFTLAVTTFVTDADLPRYAFACVAMAGAVGVWAMTNAGQMTAGVGGGVVTGRLQGPFAQPNELGAFFALMLPVGVAVVAIAERWPMRLAAIAATIAVAAAGALSLSRGAWMGAAAGVVLLWFALPVVRAWLRRAGAAALIGLLVGAAFSGGSLAGLLTERVESIGTAADNPYDYRPELWETGVRVALDNPLLGVGPGQFPIASGKGDYALYNYVAEHPHNIVLTVAAELGIYGLVAFGLVIVLLAMGFFTTLRTKPEPTRPPPAYWCAVSSTAGLLAVGVHGMVDMPLRNPIVNAAVWAMLALAITSMSAVKSATYSSSLDEQRITT